MPGTPKRISTLIISAGHLFDRNRFFAMFDAMDDVRAAHVEHPAAAMVLGSEDAAEFDTVLFYDMAGIPGTGVADGSDSNGQPSPGYRRSIEALLERGTGIVLLNHATVSWPNWPLWRQITGSSFMLRRGLLNGTEVSGSGYRGGHGPHPNPTFSVQPQVDHPVLDGLQAGFEITDELYLKTSGFEDQVQPLLRADYTFDADRFSPPPMAAAAEQADWQHPDGSDLLVWANACGASPIVSCELGDGPAAFDNPDFQQLLNNALRWTASKAGRHWAANWRPDGETS